MTNVVQDTVTSSVMNFTVTSYGNIFCVSIDDDYDPDTLTIKKGSTVVWTNDDNSLHTVTEDDDEFDSGSISPGNTWSYTFNTVGIYDYYDQYDDNLDGQIIVLVSGNSFKINQVNIPIVKVAIPNPIGLTYQ